MNILTHSPSYPVRAVALAALTLFVGVATSLAGPEFETNYEKATAKSIETNKPLIVIFSASWCPPCQQMKKSVYPSKKIEPYHGDFIWAYLDADAEENEALSTKFQVSGIPHLAFQAPDGQFMGHFAGSVSPEQFKEILDQVLAQFRNSGRNS